MSTRQPDLLDMGAVPAGGHGRQAAPEPRQRAKPAKTKTKARAEVIPPTKPKPAQAVAKAAPRKPGTAVSTKVRQQPTRMAEPKSMIALIGDLARDKSVDAAKMKELLAMQRAIEERDAERAFNEAMQRVQSRLSATPIVRKAKGDKGVMYAKLEAIQQVLTPIITAEGFSLMFGTEESSIPTHFRVTAVLSHVAGHSRREGVPVAIDDKGPKGNDNKTVVQGMGSAMSYGRRYLLTLLFNLVLVGEDNDGAKVVTTITEDQQAQLQKAMNFKGLSLQDLKDWLGSLRRPILIETLADIPAPAFDNIMNGVRAAQGGDGK